MGNRAPVTRALLAALTAGVTTAACLAVSAYAVAHVTPINQSLRSATFVLAYHDKHPPWWSLAVIAVIMLFLVLRARTPLFFLASAWCGGVIAQVAAWLIWGSVPDYIHTPAKGPIPELISNAADYVLAATAVGISLLWVFSTTLPGSREKKGEPSANEADSQSQAR